MILHCPFPTFLTLQVPSSLAFSKNSKFSSKLLPPVSGMYTYVQMPANKFVAAKMANSL